MFRRRDELIPIEQDILEVGLRLLSNGQGQFHGFLIAEEIQHEQGRRLLTAHGTLYKALHRLEDRGLLSSEWEAESRTGGRPRRRLYRLTGDGLTIAATIQNRPRPAGIRRVGLAI
jgi:PadR family transcriptional regulator